MSPSKLSTHLRRAQSSSSPLRLLTIPLLSLLTLPACSQPPNATNSNSLNHIHTATKTNTPSKKIDFVKDIKPILSDRCYNCHGFDDKDRKGKLRLDSRAGAFAKTKVGDAPHIITPNSPDKSELYLRIITDDPEDIMPPPKSKLKLSQREKNLIKQWIQQGAPWDDSHWSYSPITKPKLPPTPPSSKPIHPIDRFIRAKLKEANLTPSNPADKPTLIRRVTFDLTGLPPTPAEINAFLADKSPYAFEKVVDRLLKSPRYGERMAADWLDIARYSDSYGYQVDRDRFVWPWRDWVIKAFNSNLPYDKFITHQLAGDLLPNATDQQILATTFNRLHPQKVEGGSVPEEFRVEYVADRTHTFGTAFLGMTLECARCHDHKYDPISQKEYYQFFAFFNQIDEAGLYAYFNNSVPTPTLRLINDATKQKIKTIEASIKAHEQKLNTIAALQKPAFNNWLKARPKTPTIPNRILHLDFPKNHGPNIVVPGKVKNALKLTGDDAVGTRVGNFRRYDPFSVSLWINTPDLKERAVIYHRSRAWTDAASRGYELLLEQGKLSAALIHFWPGNAIRVKTTKPIPIKTWLHVTITYDGSSRAAGLNIFINGKPAQTKIDRDQLTKNMSGGGGNNIAIGARFRDRGFKNGLVDEFKVFNRQLTSLEIAHLANLPDLQRALITPLPRLTPTQKQSLFKLYLSLHNEPYKKQLTQLRASREQRSKTVDNLTEIMVMRQMNNPRKSYLLARGAYDKRTDEVQPATPASLPALLKKPPKNRLDLANWLTHPKNPLTARVTVNRFWQMLFGQGLVRTPEDFGSQGALPTHPLLLDYLAADFIQNKWDIKRTLKLIITSATYKQSSAVSRLLLQRDPENKLLARMSSYRLPAEMIRDNALAASNLLIDRIGGPPAKPYELEASFKPSRRDRGQGLYRRSVYTFWKRTAPAPAMTTLDASKRDICRPQRERTATPLQALVMLNGPQFIEAAKILAQNLIKKHNTNTPALIADMFRRLTSQKINGTQARLLLNLYNKQLAYFKSQPKKTAALLNVGDTKPNKIIPQTRLAAITILANTLMNYHDCVMKR